MTSRSEYFLKLPEVQSKEMPILDVAFQVRTAQTEDASLLAQLMINAYCGTIDTMARLSMMHYQRLMHFWQEKGAVHLG